MLMPQAARLHRQRRLKVRSMVFQAIINNSQSRQPNMSSSKPTQSPYSLLRSAKRATANTGITHVSG
jgi:hypothetical protein